MKAVFWKWLCNREGEAGDVTRGVKGHLNYAFFPRVLSYADTWAVIYIVCVQLTQHDILKKI